MSNSIVRWALGTCLTLGLAVGANAATISGTINYNGTSGVAATGNGTFTVTGSTLTAFTFNETIGGAAYSYTLADVPVANFSDSTPAATGLNNLTFTLLTNAKSGSPNTLGTSAFNIQFNGGTATGSNIGAQTQGSGTLGVTATATPEPSSFALMGLGIAGLFAARRRFIRS